MSTITPPELGAEPLGGWVPSPGSLYRMSIEKYEAMVASGVFTKRDRFELIYGLLVTKMTEYPPHAASCEVVREAVQPLLPPGWCVRGDRPLKIPDRASIPEPDLVVARGSWRDDERRHPEPRDVALVVEVSSSSLGDDRRLARLYGEAGIPAYWIVNLVDRRIEVFADPGPGGYRSVQTFKEDDAVPFVLETDTLGTIRVGDILPREIAPE
ncbi:MAG: Uma2 family endonuclease [Isosphaeraceae bacterium]